jgi:hypothetical protein
MSGQAEETGQGRGVWQAFPSTLNLPGTNRTRPTNLRQGIPQSRPSPPSTSPPMPHHARPPPLPIGFVRSRKCSATRPNSHREMILWIEPGLRLESFRESSQRTPTAGRGSTSASVGRDSSALPNRAESLSEEKLTSKHRFGAVVALSSIHSTDWSSIDSSDRSL